MTADMTDTTKFGPRVLLLDDDTDALEELGEILELEDLETFSATNVEEAYACLCTNTAITVVVTDVHLVSPCGEVSNGLDFVALAMRRFAGRQLSFVVLSGDANAVGRSFETGAVDFLTKPLMPEALVETVRRALDSDGTPGEDVSSALLRKVEETTKSLQKANADLVERDLKLSASREDYERRRLHGGKLKRAIADEQIVPWFQPQVCVRTGRILGFEALARWADPMRGVRGPHEFLPLADEVGLMTELGISVQRQAFTALAGFQRHGLGHCTMSINLTGEVLARPDIVDMLALEIEMAGLEPEAVAVEVLESAMLGDGTDDPIKTNVNRLAQVGIRVELDDFGTGHAALSSLRDLDVHRVKIDRSFVQDIDKDRKLQKFTRALISLAQALEIEVLAEGVETESELSWLVAEGCDLMQGYLVAAPMPASAVLDWADNWRSRRDRIIETNAA